MSGLSVGLLEVSTFFVCLFVVVPFRKKAGGPAEESHAFLP